MARVVILIEDQPDGTVTIEAAWDGADGAAVELAERTRRWFEFVTELAPTPNGKESDEPHGHD
jgi:hypothetical protein